MAETDGLSERDGVLDLVPDAVLPMPDSVLDAVPVRAAALREQCQAAVELAVVFGVRVDLLVDAPSAPVVVGTGSPAPPAPLCEVLR